MYLEESEQRDASGEATLPTDSMLTEQCQVAKLTEDNGSAELDGNALVELSEQLVADREVSPSRLCMEHCNNYEGKGDSERADHYSEFGSILECVTIHDKTFRLSQPLEGWYWRPSRTFEPCVNHSSAHNGSPCYTEQQQHIFQQPEPTHHSFEYLDLAVYKSDVNSEQGETCSCTSEYIEQLELSQQYNPSGMQYKCLECEPETSTKDCEKHEMTGFVPDASESADESDCDTEHSEYDDIQNQSMAADDNDERGYLSDSRQERGSDDEPCTVSEDVNCLHRRALMQVYFDENEGLIRATDHLNTRGDEDLNETSQTSEQNDSDKTFVGFFMEEDSSDGSSSESKSFKTCADESENSLDSLGSEYEKETQEYSSDEQTQWESFDDDEEQCNITERVHDEKKTSNFVLEDYFDLFDRGDYYGPSFTQPQHYISCFDGGDIHDCLYRDQLKAKKQPQNAYNVPEMNPQMNDTCFYSSEKDLGGVYGCDSSLRSESEARPEKCKAEHELDGDSYEETNVNGAQTCNVTELMNVPYVQNILIKGDTSDDISRVETDNKEPSKEPPNISYSQEAMFRACSEKESYWSLREREHETLELIEEYYTSQIKSLQMTAKQSLNGFVVLNDRMISARASSWSKDHSVASQSKSEFQHAQAHAVCPEESQIGKVNDYCFVRGERANSNEDSGSTEISRQVRADIIHSIVNYDKTEEGDALARNRWTEDSEDESCDSDADELCDCEYCIPPNTQVPTKALLPQLKSHDTGKICVVIDLDETLVHSSFTPVNNADFVTPVDIDGTIHQVYVSKRPHVDEFLRRMGEMFECVLFTASLSKYADPVSDVLDKWGAFRSRLFREACVFHKGNYVKDLSHLGRDLNKVIIIDNSPASYIFHPDNAVPVESWFDDTSDSELLDLIPFFERLSNVDDVYDVLKEQRSLG